VKIQRVFKPALALLLLTAILPQSASSDDEAQCDQEIQDVLEKVAQKPLKDALIGI
jgi:hypothetical protein